MDSGQVAQITNLTQSPSGLAWSPDGKWIAFIMRVPAESEPFAKMPEAPEGAEWAERPKVIDRMLYRSDGRGYLEGGYDHLFVVPSEGGTPRQFTRGDFDHKGPPSWASEVTSRLQSSSSP